MIKETIKISPVVLSLIFLSLLSLTSAIALCENSILVEAESFQCKGGWQIDQQFVDIIGSSYLIAHGL
jgi:hypothetical protein